MGIRGAHLKFTQRRHCISNFFTTMGIYEHDIQHSAWYSTLKLGPLFSSFICLHMKGIRDVQANVEIHLQMAPFGHQKWVSSTWLWPHHHLVVIGNFQISIAPTSNPRTRAWYSLMLKKCIHFIECLRMVQYDFLNRRKAKEWQRMRYYLL